MNEKRWDTAENGYIARFRQCFNSPHSHQMKNPETVGIPRFRGFSVM